MVQTPFQSKQNLQLTVPSTLGLRVTPEQFATLAHINSELRLERTATGELIVNPPTGWETGERNIKLSTRLCNWWECSELGKFDRIIGRGCSCWFRSQVAKNLG